MEKRAHVRCEGTVLCGDKGRVVVVVVKTLCFGPEAMSYERGT